MSFIESKQNIRYQPGYFLASEDCERVTVQVEPTHAQVVTMADGSKYVPGGAIMGGNNSSARGILYEDVDVTKGAMPGSMVTKGTVYEDRMPASPESDAKTAMAGISFISAAPAITRPSAFDKKSLTALTVTSAAGTGDGKTDVSFTGYTPATGERTVYKIHATVAPAVHLGEVLSIGASEGQWTAGTFPLDELASTDGYKITVAVVDATDAVIAAGSATIDVK